MVHRRSFHLPDGPTTGPRPSLIARIVGVATIILEAMHPFAAAADPAGPWPEDSRGVPQPRPPWVLVIPAIRDGDGSLKVWDRENEWSREWIVPRPASDLRTVSTVGDAEDERRTSGDDLDYADEDVLRGIAGKYGAPAIALAVSDEFGQAAVMAWTPGVRSSWEVTNPGEPEREGCLRLIAELFSGRSASTLATGLVRITGVRTVDGIDEYRVEPVEQGAGDTLLDMPTMIIVEQDLHSPEPYMVARPPEGRTIEDVLGDRLAP